MTSSRSRRDRIEESDRGCVLVVVADIETALERLLRQVFAARGARKKVVDSLLGAMGPLGSFSAKLRISHAFGLISPKLYDDMEFLRKLRNEAAHSSSEFDLLSHPMASSIEALHCVQDIKTRMPRYNIAPSAGESATSQPLESPGIQEARIRLGGYVKARKSYIVVGAMSICADIDAVGIAFQTRSDEAVTD